MGPVVLRACMCVQVLYMEGDGPGPPGRGKSKQYANVAKGVSDWVRLDSGLYSGDVIKQSTHIQLCVM